MNNLSFDLTNSIDMLKKLLWDTEEYLKDRSAVYKGLNCAMTAWHLSEWVYHEYQTTAYKKLADYQEALKLMCPQLQIMHDISNGTKHYTLSRHVPKVKETKPHEGFYDQSFYDSDFYDVPSLKITMETNEEYYFPDVVKAVRDFWVNYFETELSHR